MPFLYFKLVRFPMSRTTMHFGPRRRFGKSGTGNLHGLFPTEFLKNGGTGNTEEYARMC